MQRISINPNKHVTTMTDRLQRLYARIPAGTLVRATALQDPHATLTGYPTEIPGATGAPTNAILLARTPRDAELAAELGISMCPLAQAVLSTLQRSLPAQDRDEQQIFHGDVLKATDTEIHYLALWGASTHLMLVSLQSRREYPEALIVPAGALLKHHLVTRSHEGLNLRDRFYARHQPRVYPHFSYASLMPLLPEEFEAHALLQAAADRHALPDRKSVV